MGYKTIRSQDQIAVSSTSIARTLAYLFVDMILVFLLLIFVAEFFRPGQSSFMQGNLILFGFLDGYFLYKTSRNMLRLKNTVTFFRNGDIHIKRDKELFVTAPERMRLVFPEKVLEYNFVKTDEKIQRAAIHCFFLLPPKITKGIVWLSKRSFLMIKITVDGQDFEVPLFYETPARLKQLIAKISEVYPIGTTPSPAENTNETYCLIDRP